MKPRLSGATTKLTFDHKDALLSKFRGKASDGLGLLWSLIGRPGGGSVGLVSGS